MLYIDTCNVRAYVLGSKVCFCVVVFFHTKLNRLFFVTLVR